MNIKELHWAAGFLEGEGSFCSHAKRAYVHSKVNAVQKEMEPLERLQRLFGGTITKGPKSSVYIWSANGSLARGVAMTVFSLMSSRRKNQIKQMLSKDTSATWGTSEHRSRVGKKVKETKNAIGS